MENDEDLVPQEDTKKKGKPLEKKLLKTRVARYPDDAMPKHPTTYGPSEKHPTGHTEQVFSQYYEGQEEDAVILKVRDSHYLADCDQVVLNIYNRGYARELGLDEKPELNTEAINLNLINLQARNENGFTLLHWAVKCGDVDAMKDIIHTDPELLNAKYSRSIFNSSLSPIDFALHYAETDPKKLAVVSCLIENRADTRGIDYAKETPTIKHLIELNNYRLNLAEEKASNFYQAARVVKGIFATPANLDVKTSAAEKIMDHLLSKEDAQPLNKLEQSAVSEGRLGKLFESLPKETRDALLNPPKNTQTLEM